MNTLSNWVYSSALSRPKKNRTQWSLCYCMLWWNTCYSPDSTQINTNNNQCRRKATNPKLDSREELSTNLPSTTFQCQTEWLARNRFLLTRTMHTANVSLVLITESRLVYYSNEPILKRLRADSSHVSTGKRFTLPVFAHEQTHSLRNKTWTCDPCLCACVFTVRVWVGRALTSGKSLSMW